MTQHEASRTLVKSPPELWAECSDAGSLARHLGQFGEIRITRLEPETAVAWEGEHASGTVRLEPSGWGTRVILTARTAAQDLPPEPPTAVPQPSVPEPQTAVQDPPPEPSTTVPHPSVPEPQTAVQDPPPEPPITVPHPLAPEPPAPEPASVRRVRPARNRLLARLQSLLGGKPAREPSSARQAGSAPQAPEPAGSAPQAPQQAGSAPQAPEPAGSAPQAPQQAGSAPEPPEPAEPPEPPWPQPVAEVESPGSEPEAGADPSATLRSALDSLGQAHHRPFSRP
jgi:hypothetical protein